MNKIEELDGTLDYINNLVDSTYNRIYDDAKNMNKEQLLELLGNILTVQKTRDSELLKEISKTENLNLAVNYAHISSSYIKSIDASMDKIISKNMQPEPTKGENALPDNILK